MDGAPLTLCTRDATQQIACKTRKNSSPWKTLIKYSTEMVLMPTASVAVYHCRRRARVFAFQGLLPKIGGRLAVRAAATGASTHTMPAMVWQCAAAAVLCVIRISPKIHRCKHFVPIYIYMLDIAAKM